MTEKRLSTFLRGTPERQTLEITIEEKDKKKPDKLESKSCSGKQVVAFIMASIAGCLFWDAFITPPEKRWLRPDTSERFLEWAEANPYSGFWALLLVIASCVVLMIPMGTPLTLGCGYIYKGVYGWGVGLVVATAVSVLGSGIGAVMCFLLGRYLMRDRVRKWIRNYPLFDAIDVGKYIIMISSASGIAMTLTQTTSYTAISEQGLRIMAMLYLTPVLPLGPVSYMCGTTSMALSSFTIAKLASLPLMILYCFIGASTGTLLSDPTGAEAKKIESNKTLIVLGILLSAVMISCISHYIRKELDKILERQKRDPPQKERRGRQGTEESVELGMATARHRRTVLSSIDDAEDDGS
jgi:uncharacterized membrane protein YdjX (TVP38/TMEM64 family)